MRTIISSSLFIISAALLNSCTKVIDVKLNDSAKKYVIEASLTDEPGNTNVMISQTKNFNEDNHFPGVSGASVAITDNSTGISTPLTESAAGTYTHPSLVGISGRSYTLHVTVGGETFTAVSAMPQKVNFDTAYITQDNIFGEVWNLANLGFNDPAGFGNCYNVYQYVNGKKTKQVFVTNDDYFDNKRIDSKLYMYPNTEDEDKIKSGDTVRLELVCIDPAVYKYWFSLQQSATGSNNQSAAPANPVTNIQGGALGYFSAQTIQTKTVVVP